MDTQFGISFILHLSLIFKGLKSISKCEGMDMLLCQYQYYYHPSRFVLVLSVSYILISLVSPMQRDTPILLPQHLLIWGNHKSSEIFQILHLLVAVYSKDVKALKSLNGNEFNHATSSISTSLKFEDSNTITSLHFLSSFFIFTIAFKFLNTISLIWAMFYHQFLQTRKRG